MISGVKKLCITTLLAIFSIAMGQCNPSSVAIEGQLTASALKDGFPTKLVSVEPSAVTMSCQTDQVIIQLSPPTRLKDGGPKLKGPFEGYFIYDGKRYTHRQQVLTDSAFELKAIYVGMSIANNGAILPAANNYRYSVVLTANPAEDR